MYNANWNRWITASASKYFKDKVDSTLPLMLEGQDPKGFTDKNHCEFRINGPDSNETGKDVFRLDCTINIILNIFKSTNIYDVQKFCGVIQNAFGPINIFRYGKETGDDGTYVGCLTIRPGGAIQNLQLGEFENLNQSTISAPFVTYLE